MTLRPEELPDDPIARNRVITAAYAGWYAARPDLFKWAGLSAYASLAAGAYLRLLSPAGRAHRLAPGLATASLEVVRATNDAVFRDLGRAHLLYLEPGGGLPALEATFGAGHALVRGFRALDDARRTTDPARAAELAWEGNGVLLEHEQRRCVQPHLERSPRAFARLTSLALRADFTFGDPRVPQRRAPSFAAWAVRHRRPVDVTRLPERWEWLVRKVVPAWRDLDALSPPALLERMRELASTGALGRGSGR